MPKRIGRTQLEFVGAQRHARGGFKLDRFEIDHERVHLLFEGIAGRVALAAAAVADDLTRTTSRAQAPSCRCGAGRIRRRRPRRASCRPGSSCAADRVHDRLRHADRHQRPPLRRHGREHLRRRAPSHDALLRGELRAWKRCASPASATLRAADPMQLEGDARIAHPRDRTSPCGSIAASGSGDLERARPSPRDFTSPFRRTSPARREDLTTALELVGQAGRCRLRPARVGRRRRARAQITGTLEVRGDAAGSAATGRSPRRACEPGAFQTVFEGYYAARVITANRIEVTHRSLARARRRRRAPSASCRTGRSSICTAHGGIFAGRSSARTSPCAAPRANTR